MRRTPALTKPKTAPHTTPAVRLTKEQEARVRRESRRLRATPAALVRAAVDLAFADKHPPFAAA